MLLEAMGKLQKLENGGENTPARRPVKSSDALSAIVAM
jgi:hypothetical protein